MKQSATDSAKNALTMLAMGIKQYNNGQDSSRSGKWNSTLMHWKLEKSEHMAKLKCDGTYKTGLTNQELTNS
jgi:hypothetical protein